MHAGSHGCSASHGGTCKIRRSMLTGSGVARTRSCHQRIAITKNMRIWTGEALEKKTSLEALNTAPVLSHSASSQPSARGSRVRRALARALLALCIDRSNSTPNLLRPLPPYKHPIALAVLLFAALPTLLLPQERGLGEELDSSLLACGFVASSSFAMV